MVGSLWKGQVSEERGLICPLFASSFRLFILIQMNTTWKLLQHVKPFMVIWLYKKHAGFLICFDDV